MKFLRKHFEDFGVAEDITTDEGSEYTAQITKDFLRRWGVTHRMSSAYNPHANMRSELGVHTIKQLLRDNITPTGSLDCDKFSQALLTFRNTPCTDSVWS